MIGIKNTKKTVNFLGHGKNECILTMPVDLLLYLFKHCTKCSPFNKNLHGSFYDTNEKTWGYTPDGSIRISDHWNFYAKEKWHCQTNVGNELIENLWVLAKYDASMDRYIVLQTWVKDHTAYNTRQRRKRLKGQYKITKIDKLFRNQNNRLERAKALRAEKRKKDKINLVV